MLILIFSPCLRDRSTFGGGAGASVSPPPPPESPPPDPSFPSIVLRSTSLLVAAKIRGTRAHAEPRRRIGGREHACAYGRGERGGHCGLISSRHHAATNGPWRRPSYYLTENYTTRDTLHSQAVHLCAYSSIDRTSPKKQPRSADVLKNTSFNSKSFIKLHPKSVLLRAL